MAGLSPLIRQRKTQLLKNMMQTLSREPFALLLNRMQSRKTSTPNQALAQF